MTSPLRLPRSRAAVAAVTAALALAACGNSGSAEKKPAGAPTAEGTRIDMKDIEYVPKAATVEVGKPVTWTNSDSVPHTVTAENAPGGKLDSGSIAAGDTFEYTFKEAGTVEYVCTIHPNQTGTLTIK